MMRWLRRFFYSDDPPVKVVGGLPEPEAEMWREILANNGIPAFTKALNGAPFVWGRGTGTNCELFVKENDLERAREVLAPLLQDRNAGKQR